MMSIDELQNDSRLMTAWERHRFFVLVAAVILIALFLVSVALGLYNSSGAAQVDLSRPGFQDVRAKAERDTGSSSFPATGQLDQASLDTFRKLYKDRAQKVTAADSYDAAGLSEDALQLMTTAPASSAP